MLARNVGKNSFAFLLETGGLILTETNGQFILVNPETEQQVGQLGEIIVFDSAGQVVRGQLTAQTILAGQKYGITISVDQEFLASATYPVSIDPTVDLTIEGDFDFSNVVEDIGLYNHENAWGSTFEGSPYIGKTAINGYIICIRKNMSTMTTSASSMAMSCVPQVTLEIIEEAYEQAMLEVWQMDSDYVIVEQEGTPYYNVESNEYFYRVNTTYKTELGAFGVITTMYKL